MTKTEDWVFVQPLSRKPISQGLAFAAGSMIVGPNYPTREGWNPMARLMIAGFHDGRPESGECESYPIQGRPPFIWKQRCPYDRDASTIGRGAVSL